jgi:hypothetical protein
MKIPVKSSKIIQTEVVTTTLVTIPNFCMYSIKEFQLLVDYLLTCEFVAASCKHNDLKSFLGYNQGGWNSSSLSYIEVIHEEVNKITVQVMWIGCKNLKEDGAVIIFKKPIQE